MAELGFLPSLPFSPGQLALFGLLLLAGLIGGQLFSRVLYLPRITGFIAMGLLLGPNGLNWLSSPMLEDARIFVDISLGLILFELGRRLDYHWLRRNHWLLLTGVSESALSFALVYVTLGYFGIQPVFAAMAAAIGISTSPAVLLLVAHELRAEGQVTDRAITLGAINSAFAFFLFTMFLSYLHLEYQAGWMTIALHPLYLLVGSVSLGYLMSKLTIRLGKWVGKREDSQFILLVAMIVLTIGIADQLKLSELLTLLTFGLLSKNLDRGHALVPLEFGHGGQLFFVILFVFAGAKLHLGAFPEVAWIALSYVGARFVGKSLMILALARPNGISYKQAGLVGVSLVPMSGLAIVMVQSTAEVYPEFGAKLAAIVLSAVAVLEIVGPIATQFALKRAGEASPDRT